MLTRRWYAAVDSGTARRKTVDRTSVKKPLSAMSAWNQPSARSPDRAGSADSNAALIAAPWAGSTYS